jgi:hypothetical protein
MILPPPEDSALPQKIIGSEEVQGLLGDYIELGGVRQELDCMVRERSRGHGPVVRTIPAHIGIGTK